MKRVMSITNVDVGLFDSEDNDWKELFISMDLKQKDISEWFVFPMNVFKDILQEFNINKSSDLIGNKMIYEDKDIVTLEKNEVIYPNNVVYVGKVDSD